MTKLILAILLICPLVMEMLDKLTILRLFLYTPFFINNPFLTLAPKIVYAFLKKSPKKLFSNCLVDGLLTSIV